MLPEEILGEIQTALQGHEQVNEEILVHLASYFGQQYANAIPKQWVTCLFREHKAVASCAHIGGTTFRFSCNKTQKYIDVEITAEMNIPEFQELLINSATRLARLANERR